MLPFSLAGYGSEAYGSEEAVTEVVVVRVDVTSASLHVVTRWVTKALVMDIDMTYVSYKKRGSCIYFLH